MILKTKQFVENEFNLLKNKEKPDGYFHIFLFGDNEASKVYVRNKMADAEKVGIKTYLHKLNKNTPRELAELRIKSAIKDKPLGIMIQFPLPEHLRGIEQLVPAHLDVDGLAHNSDFYPCTPSGVIYYLEKGLNKKLEGKNICIVGRSELVGRPLANMLTDKNATVTLCHSKTYNLKEHTTRANIVICAIGKPMYFDESYFSDGTLVIDVGINFDENGKMCGDVDSKSIDESNYLRKIPVDVTAVPGGVGLLTRLSLMRHCFGLDKRR